MNYRNQPMNTNMNNRGFARRRPVYPDFGCDAPVTPPDSCGCGCDTPITPPPNPCGCNISIPGNSQNCGCGVSGGNRPNRPPFFGVGPEPVCPPMPPELLYCSNPAATDQLNGMALAMAYVPWQSYRNLYCAAEGFHKGTIFKELNYEFLGRRTSTITS